MFYNINCGFLLRVRKKMVTFASYLLGSNAKNDYK